MIALFTILYVLGIWLFYAKMRIRPTPVNVAVAAVIGVAAVAAIVICWQFSSPTSSRFVSSRYTIQIVPQVSGPISKLNAQPNVPLTKGKDILFEIQKDSYQYTVNQLTASLEAAKKNRQQLQAGVQVAEAAIREAEAQFKSAQAQYAMASDAGALISRVELTTLEQQEIAAAAGVDRAEASRDQAQAALQAAESSIESTQAQLDKSHFDLEQCTVYAPADGFVTNWQVREGTMVAPLPLSPVGTFVDTSQTALIATFGQNVLKNVKPGDRAEFAIKSRPGEVFSGRVEAVLQASGEGQFVTSGQLQSAANIGSSGNYAVKFILDDEELAHTLAMGTDGMAAIYTDVGAPFHVISKVTVRIQAWVYYLIPM